MKNVIKFPILVLLVSLSLISCKKDKDLSPVPKPVYAEENLTADLEKVTNETDLPGFSLAIVKNGNLAFQKSFGYADIVSNQLYTNQTTQPIGSISKTFIGAAIVKAIEDGYFTLDSPINDLLPISLVNPKNANANITVKHLVTHTSGLLDEDDAYESTYYILPGEDMNEEGAQLMANLIGTQQRPGITLEELMAEYYLEDGDLYSTANFAGSTPGQVYHYSNFASSLAAYIIEQATGKTFEAYLTEHIFEPLGMTNTSYHHRTNNATLYFNPTTPLPLYTSDSYPDGSLNTSNEDLTKYLLDMMKGATGHSQVLFPHSGYQLLFTPLLPEGVVPIQLGKNQGVFWVLDGPSISHDGGDPGLSTVLQFSEDGKTGFLLLTNMDASTDENEEKYVEAVSPIFEAVNAFLTAN